MVPQRLHIPSVGGGALRRQEADTRAFTVLLLSLVCLIAVVVRIIVFALLFSKFLSVDNSVCNQKKREQWLNSKKVRTSVKTWRSKISRRTAKLKAAASVAAETPWKMARTRRKTGKISRVFAHRFSRFSSASLDLAYRRHALIALSRHFPAKLFGEVVVPFRRGVLALSGRVETKWRWPSRQKLNPFASVVQTAIRAILSRLRLLYTCSCVSFFIVGAL